MARAVGLTVQRIDLEPGSPEDWTQVYPASKVTPAQAANFFNRLHQAQEEGGLVILATWPAWSVLTGWDDDLTCLPFVTTPRFDKVVGSIWPPIKARFAYALRPNGAAADLAATIHQALAYAGQIARGEVVPAAAGFGDQNFFGGELYDVIGEQALEEWLCPGCQENGCFSRTLKRLNDGHAVSAAFLRKARMVLDGNHADNLAEVEAGYLALAEISRAWIERSPSTQGYDDPAIRPQIKADFARMKALHTSIAYKLP